MGKPGGRKKKNAGVGVDFKKVKHKVGKKLPRAQNQTDTNFKSRTISLAQQSMAVDREGQAVSTRNLTLKELLGQCGHYSERVRKDALQGLGQLLAAHPEELRRHATLVMEAAAERISDGEAAVRTALRELLSSTLFPALGPASLAPFVPLLMAHICAAMTHLAEPIRADALGFLELLMGCRPDLVASSSASLAPVLQHFGDLLSKGSRGRSIKAGSLASLHGVVLSLERFLSKAMTALEAPSSSSGGNAAPAEPLAQQPAVLAWRRCKWPPAAAAAAEGSGSAAGASSGAGAAASDPAEAAAAVLLGHLLDCWSEAGPSQLAEAPEFVGAQSLTAILRCCDLLLGRWGAAALAGSQQDKGSLAAALVKKVSPHFPVQRPAVKAAAAVTDQLVLLNVAAAQLLARFLPGQAAGAAAGAAGTAAGWDQPWVERLLDWFAGVMADGSALPASDDTLFGETPASAEAGGSGSGKKRQRGGREAGAALTAEVYQSALDGTLRVLPLLPPPRRAQLLQAAWQLWQRSPARGSARVRVLTFWQRLLHNPADAFCGATPGGGPLLQQGDAASWLAALPRHLFELGSSNPAASQGALRLLLGAARCAPAGSALAAALQDLQPQLAPLFVVLLAPPPGKQAAAAAGPRVHVGPLGSLPGNVQDLAVDLLFHFPTASDQLLRTAAVVCLGDAFPPATACRLLGVLAAKAAAGGADPAAFAGLLLNVLSSSSAAGLQQLSWPRHAALVAVACDAAMQLGAPEAVAASLLPPLLECASSGEGSSWAAYGLLQLCTRLAAEAAQQPWQPAGPAAAALPHLMLQLQSSCQPPAAATAGGEAGGNGGRLDGADSTALCLRLVCLLPAQLLPALLAAAAESVAASTAEQQQQLLPAALQLLAALLRQQPLHVALLEQQQAVQAALAACRAVCQAAGGDSQVGRQWQEQLRQVEVAAVAVLGGA
ncbi:Testis-expressed sequence 10 [Chlorella sorokiniana]|uniref:Testis-expressed sequence 10 n=1 Tax=Chlorella sorokiniana TaxID=3076 RepID=A0A2P6TGL8_CHLSO|nr:Testis-expressed sequence 10 [Chlorella sorokiniana]|eukprot:PRW33261.1 Testis-expressed sequence 10 [Chlorella sorokiniana]